MQPNKTNFIPFYAINNLSEKDKCTVGPKKKKNTETPPIYFNTNYRTEMKLVLIIMDYCLLQIDALKIFFGVRLHGGSLPNFIFFNVNPQIFQRNRKVNL